MMTTTMCRCLLVSELVPFSSKPPVAAGFSASGKKVNMLVMVVLHPSSDHFKVANLSTMVMIIMRTTIRDDIY
jgi:hypothetical protein